MNKILIIIISIISLCACANRTTISKTDQAKLYYNKGLEYNLQKDDRTAILYYDSAIALYHDPSFFTNRGSSKYGIGDTVGALADYNFAIHLDSLEYTAIANIGAIYNDKKEYETALKYYQRSFQINNRQAIYGSIGYCLYMLGNYQEALTYFKKHLERDPVLYPQGSYLYIGNCYEKLGDMESAKPYWEKAAALGEEEARQKL